MKKLHEFERSMMKQTKKVLFECALLMLAFTGVLYSMTQQ